MIRIDSDFPGGNIKVHDIKGRDLYLSPDLRDTVGSWFYWAFRLRGGAGQKFHVHFVSDYPVAVRGPAISTDGRHTWHWTDEPFGEEDFVVTVSSDCNEIYFALAPLYTQENWDRFVATFSSFAPCDRYKLGTLTTSRKGRSDEKLHVGIVPEKASKIVVFTARHHCCEMIANDVMEGVISEILSGESKEGLWLRENASIDFIPFTDKDGVEDGDQGKNRKPHDHNRDYTDFLFPETKAIAELISNLSEKYTLDAMIDLHCPGIRGHQNSTAFMPGASEPDYAEGQITFGTLLEKSLPEGALPFFQKDFYSFGQNGNTDDDYSQGFSSTRWARRQRKIPFVTSFETPYATANGVAVTPDNARLLGRGMAIALAEYFWR